MKRPKSMINHSETLEMKNNGQQQSQPQCLMIDKGESLPNVGQFDSSRINKTHTCLTHKEEERCLEIATNQQTAALIPHFTENHPQVYCNELISVGNGDGGNGQYPYQLCKQWLPSPSNCIVYSMG